jgi:LCP family protein required for cell wall assembly
MVRQEKKPRSRRRKIFLAGCAGLLVTALAGGGIALFAYHHLQANIDTVDINQALGEDRPAPLPTGAQDILILGSDSRSGVNGDLAGGNVGGTARSDTAMVVHIPQGRARATVVSIPRDTLVTRPACTTAKGKQLRQAERVMFNSVYTAGGPTCVVKTVETMTGLRMNHYVEVDFAGFKDLVDAMGGVDVTVDRPIDDSYSGLKLAAGTHTLDGTTALAFVRTRHGVGDGSDLGRIGLQQQFVLALVAQLQRQNTLNDPVRLYRIADASTKSLTTDSGLGSLTSLASFAQSMRGLGSSATDTLMLPVAYDRIDPNRVVPAEPQDQQLWQALREDGPIPASARKSPAHGTA